MNFFEVIIIMSVYLTMFLSSMFLLIYKIDKDLKSNNIENKKQKMRII